MASKINYNNKAPFQTLEEIPDENKVNADDMNEIKTVVNNNADELDTAKENIENLQGGQGTSNAEITSLKNRVSTLESDNKTNKSDIKELQEDNETNKTNITNLQNDKVDKVEGKDLSTNDFTTELKTKLEGLENYNDTEIKADIEELANELEEKVDKVEGKGLSTNDFDNTYKEKLEGLSNYDDEEVKADITKLDEKVSTLEEDNTTNKTNIETLQEDNAQNKADISDLQESQNKQNEVLNDVILNLFPTETQEDENINIKGTIPFKFKELKLSGNSKQETRSGKNLTNYQNWTDINSNSTIISKENNQIITTIKANGYGVKDIERQLKPNTKYTFYALINFIGNYGSNYGVRIKINDSYTSYYPNGLVNFTTDETGLVNILIYAGVPYTGEDATLTVSDIRLYEGTYTIDNIPDYEPYGAMPSPEFPSPIKNVEGNVNVSVCNKNLVEGQWTTGLYNVNGDLGNTNGVYKCFKKFLKAGTYVYSYNADIIIARYVNLTSKTNLSLNEGNKNFTLGEDAEISLGFRKTDSSTWDLGENLADIEFQLEPGSTVTDYVEHQEQTVTFPLQEGQRLMLGDYLAEDGIHHVRKKVELDGTENWSLGLTNTDTISFQLVGDDLPVKRPDNDNEIVMISNCFVGFSRNQFKNDKRTQSVSSNSSTATKAIIITISKETVENLNEFKSWLASQKAAGTPVIVEYELAEEEIEAYTEEQKDVYNQICNLKAYNEETNVFSDNKISPIFKVTAIKDFNSVITQLNKALLERS